MFRRTETGSDGNEYEVVSLAGAHAVKAYRCPGCDHEIHPGASHVVVWRADGDGQDRRHWHTRCWEKRHTRGPTRRRP